MKNKENRETIRKAFGNNYIFLSQCFYSTTLTTNPLEFEMEDNKLKITQD